MSAPAIGIDLGTTYSCVGVWINDQVQIIPNQLGEKTTPSYVAFSPEQELLIGSEAKAQASINPEGTFYDVKRLIGRRFDDPCVQQDIKVFPYKIVNQDNQPALVIPNQEQPVRPEQISGLLLSQLKTDAEAYLGQSVSKCVITVPAYFNDAQRNATETAATLAGLQCLRIINEPTSACLCYGLNSLGTSDSTQSPNILIFDLGGGTFDVSILEINQGVFEVKATNGDTHLGGEDFDQRLQDYLLQIFQQQHPHVNLSNQQCPKYVNLCKKLKSVAENTKKRLSSSLQVRVDIDGLYQGLDLHCSITRSKFEELCQDLFQQCLKPVHNVLSDAELQPHQITEIVLVGGSTRIPKIQSLLKELFGGKTLNHSVNPDEAVAHGAAVQAAILNKQDHSGKTDNMVLMDVAPLSLGIKLQGD